MSLDGYKFIRFERRGRILNIILDSGRPKNAITGEMHAELSRVFNDADDDPDGDVLVLTGADDAFSAGGDVEWIDWMMSDPWHVEIGARDGRRIIYSILECQKPLICKVKGPAVGLGATIALFSDIVFATEDSLFADPHVSVGLVAGDGGAIMWPYLIGPARAKEYLMTGDAIKGPDAERMGLVNHCVPRAEIDARVDAFADRLAAGALKAIRWTKRSINGWMKPTAHHVLELSFALEMMSEWTEDHREGIDAFKERRKPAFKGR